jgi:hypothetical protein
MKSRRRIALPEARTTPDGTRLQQGFTTGGMGFRGQFAQQQSQGADVCFGSKADILGSLRNVRFTPKSGHQLSDSQMLVHSANVGRFHGTPDLQGPFLSQLAMFAAQYG